MPLLELRRCALSLLISLSALGAGAANAAELTVSAAASLTQALREIAPLFEASQPGHRLQFNFGASGALLQQIAKGAPADVLATADQETMDRAQAQQLITASLRRDFARNELVLILPAASALHPKALADLAQPAYARIAIGLPASVPVGRYTQEALQMAGLWSAIEPKMIGASNVRQALDYVARSEVDAGFVYATDAALLPDKVRRAAFTVPTRKPVLYPAAPVAASTQPALARAFVEFLLTPAARTVLLKHGFAAP